MLHKDGLLVARCCIVSLMNYDTFSVEREIYLLQLLGRGKWHEPSEKILLNFLKSWDRL